MHLRRLLQDAHDKDFKCLKPSGYYMNHLLEH
jgi:hypothetical protein